MTDLIKLNTIGRHGSFSPSGPDAVKKNKNFMALNIFSISSGKGISLLESEAKPIVNEKNLDVKVNSKKCAKQE